MKRYPVVIGATAAGLVGVLTFHSHNGSFALPAGPTTSAGSSTGNNSSHGGTPKNGASHKTTTSTIPPSPAGARSATGSLEQYGYGQLSVRVTMAGGRITGVAVATLQTADTYSQQLANQIIPILRREVLSAQSAKINGLSGATYTSEAYAYSVQSALDNLHK